MLDPKQIVCELESMLQKLSNSVEFKEYKNALYQIGCMSGYCKLLWFIAMAAITKKDETEGGLEHEQH